MPEPVPAAKPGAKGKPGGLPVWAWFAAAGVGLLIGYFLLKEPSGGGTGDGDGALGLPPTEGGGGGGSSGGGLSGAVREALGLEPPKDDGGQTHHSPFHGGNGNGGGDGDSGDEEEPVDPGNWWAYDPAHPVGTKFMPVIDPDEEYHPVGLEYFPEQPPPPPKAPPPIYEPGENPIPGEIKAY